MANFATDGKLCIEREIEVIQTKEESGDILSKFDINETCKWISDNKYSKVCLQFPDDLLHVCDRIYDEIKKKVDVDLYVLGDTSYASCCVDSVAAMHVQAEALVHYGHTCLSKSNMPVFTVLPKKHLDVESTLAVITEKFNTNENNKLCLFYETEYQHNKDIIAKHWFEKYPNGYIAYIVVDDVPGRCFGRLIKNREGNVLPDDALKECVCVHIGSRGQTMFNFTVSIPAKEWYLLDPSINKIEQMQETMWFKRRRFFIEKCKDADVVGILVCKMAGDQTKDIITRLKKLCTLNSKKSYIIYVGKPNVAKLANFSEIDIYVMIACPENELYSNRDFYKPIVYPYELEVALNTNRDPYFTTHVTDYDDLLPGNRNFCEIGQIEEATDVSLITGKIRETKVQTTQGEGSELVGKQNWALENIGQNLQDRSWKGLEQKLGETEVKKAEEGRQGIPLQYTNEPE